MLSSRSVDEQEPAPPPPRPPPSSSQHHHHNARRSHHHRCHCIDPLTPSTCHAGVASRHRRTSWRRHTPDRRARRAARRRGDDGTRPDLAREGVGCVRARAVSARPGARARCVRPALPPTGACVPSPISALNIIPSLLAAHASHIDRTCIAVGASRIASVRPVRPLILARRETPAHPRATRWDARVR